LSKVIIIATLVLSGLSLACGGQDVEIIEKEVVKEVPVEKLVVVQEVKEISVIKEVPVEVLKIVVPTPEPVRVTDALGQQLTFDSVPQRIVTLSPTASELLYFVGGRAVGRDRASNFPLIMKSLPDVGSAYNPSMEALMAMRPDLVIIEALTQARFAPMLAKTGITVMAVKTESLEDITANLTMIGSVIGNEKLAQQAVDDITGRLELVGQVEKSVLLLISDQERNLYAAKPESYTGLIVDVLGMENKAAGLADSGVYPGFSLMTAEAILRSNPDIIVTITPAPKPAPRLSVTMSQIPPFAALKAMQTGMIIEGDVDLFLQAPGPRLVEAVEFLKARMAQQ
tara:strand:- start:1739 stop:2761 length:1023 start_codon:yes stop_codon:yes gene_type:complete